MDTKHCGNCDTEKSTEEFSWRNKSKGKLQSWCKLCMSKHSQNRYKDNPELRQRVKSHRKATRIRNRQYVWDYLLENPCVICGEKDPVVLEFDHIDSCGKIDTISSLAYKLISLDTLQEEIDKCQVLCANCHRRKTAETSGWYKNIVRGG